MHLDLPLLLVLLPFLCCLCFSAILDLARSRYQKSAMHKNILDAHTQKNKVCLPTISQPAQNVNSAYKTAIFSLIPKYIQKYSHENWWKYNSWFHAEGISLRRLLTSVPGKVVPEISAPKCTIFNKIFHQIAQDT